MPDPFTASGPEELATKETLLSMSGFDFMRAILTGEIAGPAIAKTLGFQLHTVEEGRVVFRGTPEFAHTNPMGTVHGGWYGTLLDSCMACAVMSMVPKGHYYTTLEFRINITRNLPLETEIEAEGFIQHMGRSTGVARGELRGVTDRKLYATGSTTCMIMSGRA